MEYERLLDCALAPGSALPYETGVDLAESVLQVKGYGPIKEAAIARWRKAVVALAQAPSPGQQIVRT